MLPFEPLAKFGADLGSEHLLALPSAMLGRHPPARPATHCPARPAPRRGVTAPPLTALTNGGESLVATTRLTRGSAPFEPREVPALRPESRAGALPLSPRGGDLVAEGEYVADRASPRQGASEQSSAASGHSAGRPPRLGRIPVAEAKPMIIRRARWRTCGFTGWLRRPHWSRFSDIQRL